MSKDYKRYIGRESDMQTTVAKLLDSLGVLWFHPPNGGTRIRQEAIALKRQGVKAGVSDVVILEARRGYHGLFIELKTKHNKPTPHQKQFMAEATKRGYLCKWTNSLDEFVDIIEEYLNLNKNG